MYKLFTLEMKSRNFIVSFGLLVGCMIINNVVICEDKIPWEWDWQWTNNWARRTKHIIDGKDIEGHKPECPADTLLQCWACRRVSSDEECVAKGHWKTCLPDETCVYDKRWLKSQNTVSIRRGCIANSRCVNTRFLKPKCGAKRTSKWTTQCRVCGEGTWFRCRKGQCPGRYLCKKCENVDSKEACERADKFESCNMDDPVCEEKSVIKNGKVSYSSGCKSRLDCYNQPGLLPYCRESSKDDNTRTCVRCSEINTDYVRCLTCTKMQSKEACEQNTVYEVCDAKDSVCKETSGWNSVTGEMYFSSQCIKKDACPSVHMGDISCSPVANTGVTECTSCQEFPECLAPKPVKCRKCDQADGKRLCKELEECPETKGVLPVCKETFMWNKDGKLSFSSACGSLNTCQRENGRRMQCKSQADNGMIECTKCSFHWERQINTKIDL